MTIRSWSRGASRSRNHGLFHHVTDVLLAGRGVVVLTLCCKRLYESRHDLMFLPFTFTMAVPGIMNPFSKPPDLPGGTGDTPAPEIAKCLQEKQWHPEHRPHPSSLPPPEPLARKRGWQPSSPEPSPAATITASTRGYLNVRPNPRYRDFTITPGAREEDEEAEMPGGKYLCIADHAYNPIVCCLEPHLHMP